MIKTCHKIYFAKPLNQENHFKLSEMKVSLNGVLTIEHNLNNTQILIHYDASILNFSVILNYLSSNELPLKISVIQSLKATWFDYLDSTAQDNANAPPPACCNKAPKIAKYK